ncbi:hypothetical protein PENTCL1PPCAC_27010, partial [Pristionchus entomophagus]
IPTIHLKKEDIFDYDSPQDLMIKYNEHRLKVKQEVDMGDYEMSMNKEGMEAMGDSLKMKEGGIVVKNEVIDIDEMRKEYMGDYMERDGGALDYVINNMKQDPEFILRVEENEEEMGIFFLGQIIRQIELNPNAMGEQQESLTNLYDHIKRKSAARLKEMAEKEEEKRLRTVAKKKNMVGRKKKGIPPKKNHIQKSKQKGKCNQNRHVAQAIENGGKRGVGRVNAMRREKYRMDGGKESSEMAENMMNSSIEQADATKRISKKKSPYDPSEFYLSKRQKAFPLSRQTTHSFDHIPMDDNHNEMLDGGVDHSSTVPLIPVSQLDATQLYKYSSVPIHSLPSVESVQQKKIGRSGSYTPIKRPHTNQISSLINRDPPLTSQGGKSMEGFYDPRRVQANQYFDPRRIQKKQLGTDFIPQPPDYDGFPRVVWGPIPQLVPISLIKDFMHNYHLYYHYYKLTQFEGNFYVWLKCINKDSAFYLIQAKPIRMGSFSPYFYRPYTVLVDVGGPVGHDYLFTILKDFGEVIGLEKVEDFKWKATYLDEFDGKRATYQRYQYDGKGNIITYSPYIFIPRLNPPVNRRKMETADMDMESPASPFIQPPLPLLLPPPLIIPHTQSMIPSTLSYHPPIMEQPPKEVATKRKNGEDMVLFPLVDDFDAKECLIGRNRANGHLLLGPFTMNLKMDSVRRTLCMSNEIEVKILGKFMHLFMDVNQPHSKEAKEQWDRFQNKPISVGNTMIEKKMPRSIIVETTSMHCTAEFIGEYFNKEFGGILSVLERTYTHSKLYAVNFYDRRNAVNAYRTSIHSSSSVRGQIVLMEVCKQ